MSNESRSREVVSTIRKIKKSKSRLKRTEEITADKNGALRASQVERCRAVGCRGLLVRYESLADVFPGRTWCSVCDKKWEAH